ncbi:uncharacterized protein LOC131315602 [Rhododendron vialii]|uniref:uncharacterized protein LOC131315602 n=1 Tax=Rhododendron vialii TaxID=182163 RepID=UPI00265F492D|nr:uncharacterized protein LOC131315602 [Rhododendron vialii]
MQNSPLPLQYSRYPPRKLLLFLLSNTHPAVGVMDKVRKLLSYTLHAIGVTNTIKLYNKTEEVVDIRELRGEIITGENNVFSTITVTADGEADIDPKEYDGADCRGGQLPLLMIFCGGSLLRLPNGHFLLPGEEFFSTIFETVTIVPLNDQTSTGVVNYDVKFQARTASDKVDSLKFSRDPVLDHDNGWSVQCINGKVKLTRKEGKPMALDPELFASNIVLEPETSLFWKALVTSWPGTFAYLNGKGDLEKTVGVVNDLVVQAKKYNVHRPKDAVAKVKKNVDVLNKLCAAKVEWYRPLFPWMVENFPSVAEVDQEKLKKFETSIKSLLNSFPGRSS